MKMSVVGCEASGKTVFLSALADYYNGDGRPALVPENESANSFQRFQLRQMRSLRQWPPATDPGKVIELKWTLREAGKTLTEIELLEFGGETFREAFRSESGTAGHQESVNILKSHLGASGFVVVLVSLRDLLRDPGKLSPEEFERDTEAVWVTRGLLEFLREHVPAAKIVIGLTQADLHRGEIAAAGGAGELFRQRWPSIAALAHGAPVVPVASVSAVDENGNPAFGYTTDGVLAVMNELTVSTPDTKTAREKPGPSPNRTGAVPVLLSVLLLAAAAALIIDHGLPFGARQKDRAPTGLPAITTNVIERTVTTTNVIAQTIVQTNVIEETITRTNIVENIVTKTNLVNQAVILPPDFRIWHDHRGTPIKAKWISTEPDGKRVVIEATDGRRIRALVRKFSEDDQKYIAEQLAAQTNAPARQAVPSADPAL